MKFIYATDIHYGAQPLSRKDNYNNSILEKLETILSAASEHGKLLIIGGDLFDKPNQNFMDIIQLMNLFKRYNDVRVIVNRGNPSHDGLIENSPLTLLESAGLLTTSDNQECMDIEDHRFIFAPNTGNPNDMDEFISKTKTTILLTHHIIVDNPVIYAHYLMKDITTKCQFVMCADYHPFQGIIKYNDVTFVAPGSIARRKNTKDNIEKEPMYVIYTDGDIEFAKIECVRDVWHEKVEKALQETEHDMITFDMDIQAQLEIDTLEAIWKHFISINNFNEDIVNRLRERLSIVS